MGRLARYHPVNSNSDSIHIITRLKTSEHFRRSDSSQEHHTEHRVSRNKWNTFQTNDDGVWLELLLYSNRASSLHQHVLTPNISGCKAQLIYLGGRWSNTTPHIFTKSIICDFVSRASLHLCLFIADNTRSHCESRYRNEHLYRVAFRWKLRVYKNASNSRSSRYPCISKSCSLMHNFGFRG
jgi:hypothetical protein